MNGERGCREVAYQAKSLFTQTGRVGPAEGWLHHGCS